MPAYNPIDGVPCHANEWLLQTVLREQWGFNGVTIADYGGVDKLVGLGVSENCCTAAQLALKTGVDMDLPNGTNYPLLADDENALTPEIEQQINEAVKRLLLKFKLGLFERPRSSASDARTVVGCPEHRALAIEAGINSSILLKNNDNTLPLTADTNQTIALFIGPHARHKHLGDDRQGRVILEDGVHAAGGNTITWKYALGCHLTSKDDTQIAYLEETANENLTELQRQQTDAALNAAMASDFAQEIPLNTEQHLIDEAARVASESDTVVLCLGESSHVIGENYSAARRCDRDNIRLVGNQERLLEAVAATGKPIILVLISGRPLAIAQKYLDMCQAILYLMEPGEARGTVIGKILFGAAEPTGRLPWTLPLSTGSLPVYYSQHTGERKHYAFTDKHYSYPFGYGLGYANCEISNSKLSHSVWNGEEPFTVRTTVHNNSDRDGSYVAQVYIRQKTGPVMRPAQWLIGFDKGKISSGSTKEISIPIHTSNIQRISSDGTAYLDPSLYEVGIGLSSADVTWHPLRVTATSGQDKAI